MPTMVRRLRYWKGLGRDRGRDVLQDLHHDLLVDCLEHQDEIARLSPAERYGRWFRLLEQRHYQMCRRDARRADSATTPDELPGEDAGPRPRPVASRGESCVAERLQRASTYLKNGRLNSSATAERLGMHPRDVRALWDRIATAPRIRRTVPRLLAQAAGRGTGGTGTRTSCAIAAWCTFTTSIGVHARTLARACAASAASRPGSACARCRAT